MSKKILITGINGFCASWLAEYYLKKKYEVHGTIRQRSNLENISHIIDKIKLHYCDIRDANSVRNLLEEDFNIIHHLAAVSYVHYSWINPAETLETNTVGTVNILEASRKSKSDPIIHVACSSEQYGLVFENEIPIKETNPFRPLSTYGVSKVAEELLAIQYNKSYGLKTIITRGFNHTGPRRTDIFVCSTFAKQIAMIEKKLKDPLLLHGNLEAKRDFTDVRDMVEAYAKAVEKCNYGEPYNICSGKAYSIKTILEKLIALSKTKILTAPDLKRYRPSDVPLLLGDNTKFKNKTGWRPKINFIEKTLPDILNYWREKI